MDVIVAACRVLSSRPRLGLLRTLHGQPGLTVEDLAATSSVPAGMVSKHLKLLGGFHLVHTVPRGRCLHCYPPRPGTTRHEFLRELQILVRELFKDDEQNSTPAQVWNFAGASSWEEALEKLPKFFSSYTHLRRLLLLRCLARQGIRSTEQLAAEIHISIPAIHRHLHKLQRRGLICAAGRAPTQWQLAAPVEPIFHRKLLSIILRELIARGR